MTFLNYQSYYKKNYKGNHECFMCLDGTVEKCLIKLNIQPFFIKDCHCDGFIHKHCFESWYSINKNCPVCRNYMAKNTSCLLHICGFVGIHKK